MPRRHRRPPCVQPFSSRRSRSSRARPPTRPRLLLLPPRPQLSTDEDKTLYALGLAIGQNVQRLQSHERRGRARRAGPPRRRARQRAEGRARRLRTAHPDPRARAHGGGCGEPRKQASDAWVAEQAAQPGAERSATGVVVIPITRRHRREPDRGEHRPRALSRHAARRHACSTAPSSAASRSRSR